MVILSMDDFHKIWSIKTPSQRLLTDVTRMATLMLDIQPSVQAVQCPADIHRMVTVAQPDRTTKPCRGGISSTDVITNLRSMWPTYCQTAFLQELPDKFKEIDASTIQRCLKELRYIQL